ncbi:hypothetical protein Tco_0749266 [Tanacetum coccineum]|uniref:Uncharacterized protein n=1 Tax=Tanacetum coccineum TaxID=301880 RepID=A0ABQ4YY57_9ASTR
MKRMIAKAILQERGNIQAEISSQIQNAIDNHIPSQVDASVRSYMSRHILHVHLVQSQTPYVPEQQYQLYLTMKNDTQLQQQDIAIWLALQMKCENLQSHRLDKSMKRNEVHQLQVDDYDFWTDSYASDDDEIPTKQVSQDIMEESVNIILIRMKNFESDIVGKVEGNPCFSAPRRQPLVQSCQRDPEAPPLSLINQDLLYMKKGSSRPEKIVLSLHKFPAIIFNDDDIEERTSRWVNKCVKKFNLWVVMVVGNIGRSHAKIFYIRKQKEPEKPKEVIYSNSKIIQVIKTYWELGHEHKFITEIVARRANECIINRVAMKVNLTASTISFPLVEKHKMFSIIYEPMHGIIYNNSKKDKRVMRHSEIHKFYDATLIRVLEGLKSYNNDFKYGYVERELTNDEVEYLKLFEEEIEVRLSITTR